MAQLLNGGFLLIAALCLLSSVSSQKDDTLTDRATGKDVVEAVLRKLDRSQIFPEDHSFLITLAYVESLFGADAFTFRPNYFGGLWQVDRAYFERTTNVTFTNSTYHTQIQTNFNIDWPKVTWNNLTTPLYSGIAAALYFTTVNETIPQTIGGQAAYWKEHYRVEEDIEKYVVHAEDLRNQTRCRGKMDLTIVLDSSGSINQGDPMNYARATNFTAEVIESFTLDFTRIGMLIYSATVQDIFHIQNNFNISHMATLARNATYLNGGTRTDLGMFRAIAMFDNVTQIDGVPKVMVVLTDGNADTGSNLRGAVNATREKGIKSISVGIGSRINNQELLLIALNDSRSVFQLTDFTSLQDFIFQLTFMTCDIPQKPDVNGTYGDSLVENERRTYELEVPSGGITITLDVTLGKANGYWSYSDEVPSAASHDGTLGASTFIPAPSRADSVAQDGNGAMVYLAVHGVNATNNYTISTQPGQTEVDWGTTEAGAAKGGLAGALVVGLASVIHLIINF